MTENTSRPRRKRKLSHQRRMPHPCFDVDGLPIYRLPLNCGHTAKTDADTYLRLRELGFAGHCYRNTDGKGRSYVGIPVPEKPGSNAVLARFILNAPAGKCVTYLDGDPFNLRSDNLRIVSGFSKGQEAQIIEGRKAANDNPEPDDT